MQMQYQVLDRTPLTIESPERLEINVGEKITIAKNSKGPNSKATLPNGGEIIINATILINPPKKEETIAKENAFPGSPF